MTTKSQTFLVVAATLVIGFVLGALTSGALRQERAQRYRRMNPHERFERTIERIIKPTDEQRKAIDSISKKRFNQISELRESCEDEIFAVFDSMRTDFSAVLTEEQVKRLEEHLKTGPLEVIDRRLEYLTKELNLSDEQKAQIKEIMSQAMPAFLREGPTFDVHRRPPGTSIRPKLRQTNEKIERVLTPEQLQRFRELKRFAPMRRGEREMPPPPFGQPERAKPPVEPNAN